MKPAPRLLLGSAAYGLSIGAVHSARYAALSLIKLPLLILVSVSVSAGAYFLVARLLAPELGFAAVRRLVIASYADLCPLLASFAAVNLFLALTLRPPTSTADLGEYPPFLAANVALIAVAGVLSVVRQARALLRHHALPPARALSLVAAWLAVSLVVGGQAAWYLRPFFGNRAVPDDGSFCLGSRPDFRGARSFYEAVGHLVSPPHGQSFTTLPPVQSVQ